MNLFFLFISLFFSIDFEFPAEHFYSIQEPDSIEGNFIMRIEDLAWQSGYDIISTDRMSVRFNNRYFGPYGPQPQLLLDGIPFDAEFAGLIYSQHFPISNAQIKSISTVSGIGISNHLPYQTGQVNIESEAPAGGLSLFYSGQIGHNGGEPGPWVYDPERVSPNIERFGPWLDGGISYNAEEWHARALIKYHNYYHVDPFVQNRTRNMRIITNPSQSLSADANTYLGMIEAGINKNKVKMRARFNHNQSNEFLFFQPLGREIPSVFDLNQYSLDFNFSLGKEWALKSLYQFTDKKIGYRRNRFDHNPDWNQQTNSLLFTFSQKNGIQFGADLKQVESNGSDSFNHKSVYTNIFARSAINLTDVLQIDTYLSTIVSKEEPAFNISTELAYNGFQSYSPSLSWFYAHIPAAVANPTDFRVQNGWMIYNQLDIPFTLPDKIPHSELTGISLNQHFAITGYASVMLKVVYTNHYSINIPNQQVRYDPDFNTIPGMYTLQSDQNGKTVGGDVELKVQTGQHTFHSLFFSHTQTLSGTEAFINYRKTVPKTLIQYSFLLNPYRDIKIKTAIQYRSSTTWNEFEQIDGEQTRSFHTQYPPTFYTLKNKLSSHLGIDLQIAKWFWQQRLRGSMQLKNILNHKLQSHPLGVREGFSFMARLEVRI